MTPFPKIVGNFLQEDILQYKDDLTEKLLLLAENVDFELSQNNKLVTTESPCLNFTLRKSEQLTVWLKNKM